MMPPASPRHAAASWGSATVRLSPRRETLLVVQAVNFHRGPRAKGIRRGVGLRMEASGEHHGRRDRADPPGPLHLTILSSRRLLAPCPPSAYNRHLSFHFRGGASVG